MATEKKLVPAPAEVQVRFSRPENYPIVYANNIQVSVSTWDFRLDFGEIAPPLPGIEGGSTITQKVGVIITPSMAETLVKILTYYGKVHKEQLAGQEWQPPTT